MEKGQPIESAAARKPSPSTASTAARIATSPPAFSGAGAFSDGKLSLSHEVGGDFPTLIGAQNAQDLIDYTDGIYLEFGADSHIEGIGNTEGSARDSPPRDSGRAQAGRLPDPPPRHGEGADALPRAGKLSARQRRGDDLRLGMRSC